MCAASSPPPPTHTHSKIHVLFRNKVLYPTAVLVEVKEICACRAQLDAEETRNKPWVGGTIASWFLAQMHVWWHQSTVGNTAPILYSHNWAQRASGIETRHLTWQYLLRQSMSVNQRWAVNVNLIHGRVLITGAEDVTLRLLLFVVYEALFYSVSQV